MQLPTDFDSRERDDSRIQLDQILDWIDEINRRVESLRRYDRHLADTDLSESQRLHWEEMKALDLQDLSRLIAARRIGKVLCPQVRP